MTDYIYYKAFWIPHHSKVVYPYFPRKLMLLSSGLEIVEAEN
jgi:hypothetical protein